MPTLLVIDHDVPDATVLTQDLAADCRVLWLNPFDDGMLQMLRALQGVRDLDAIHIVSHGTSGMLHLGATTLDASSLPGHGTALASIGASLKEGGSLLLYGCDVAQGAAGAAFVDAIARLTQARVAASTHKTGSPALGGSWQLDHRTGAVATAVFPTAEVQARYAHVLPAPNPLEVSALDGTTGFRLSGTSAFDLSGSSVSIAGDVNGDGFDDLLIGAVGANSYAGAGYLVFGRASWTGVTNLDLSALDGTNGFRLTGAVSGDQTGASVSDAGDINGDGYDDLIIGAPYANTTQTAAGTAYVVFGKASWAGQSNLVLSALDGSNGFTLFGTVFAESAGLSVSSAGDINGDGFDDVLVGAPNSGSSGGDTYLVFGKASWTGTASLNLSALNGINGFRLIGPLAGSNFGFSVSSGGDVNGDGLDDLIIGGKAFNANGALSGASYLVFGKASGFSSTLTLSALNGANGFRLSGVAAGDQAGYSVSAAGDVNGDGYADLIVGATQADPGGTNSGAAYVVFGKQSGFASNLQLSALDGASGFRISGAAAGDQAGVSVASAGDVNADGYDDLIIGASQASPNGASSGAGYIVFGKASGFASDLALSAINGSNGFRLSGAAASGLLGRSVNGGGDVNGDGYGDVIVGSPGINQSAGASHVVFGGNFTGTTTFAGTSGPDAMAQGTTAAESFVAGQGDDTVTGGGGADVIHAGQGNDRIVLGDIGFRQVDGGTGVDTLALAGGGLTLDLTTIPASRLTGIEVIDLVANGVSNHRLRVAMNDVITLSDSSNTLRVDGDSNDVVVPAGAWVTGATTVIGSQTYRVYTQGNATLQVDADIRVVRTEAPLSALDGTTGFRLAGAAAGDQAGLSVSGAGDINGDGFDDVLVGARYAAPSGTATGAAYVVFGKATGFASTINLSALDGTSGYRVSGVAAGDQAGGSVSNAGDVNGDGFGDFLVGASLADPTGTNTGASYVVFGKGSAFASNLNLSALDGTSGFRISGAAADDQSGRAVSTAGDVNGDGYDDLIVGANLADPTGTSSGAAYVVFGKASGFASNLNLSALNGVTGFRLAGGAAGDQAGISLSSAGDHNGDGYDDLIVGAYLADPNGGSSGASYVLFGKATGFASSIALSALNGTTGYKLSGVAAGDRSGRSVHGVGDLNGDGFADLAVGAYLADLGGLSSGAGYVVFGKGSGHASNLNLSALDGTNGFRISGGAAGDIAGFSVGSAGDVDGDGFGDLLVGAYGATQNGSSAGAAYLIFGKSTGFSSSLNLSELDGISGFRLAGVTGGDQAGFSVSAAGDVNGDGFDDLVIGARYALSSSGAGYVVFGGNFSGAVTFAGTTGADTMDAGTAAAQTFIGAQGNDTITGGGGADVIQAGEGQDRILIADTAFRHVDGGSGVDTLVFSGSAMVLDLSAVVGERLTGIEVIDLSGSGNHRLRVAATDLLALSATTNSLRVDGDANDVVVQVGTWVVGGTTVIGNQTYRAYTQGTATLQIDTDVIIFNPDVALSSLNGTSGFKLVGVGAGDGIDLTVSGAGDVNGDGFDDLLVGAPYASGSGAGTGASYLVFGKASGFASSLNLSGLNGTTGFMLAGAALSDRAGQAVGGGGDFNGDGYDDLVIGAMNADANGANAGAAYLVFGKPSGFASSLALSALNGTDGFRLAGAVAGDLAGVSAGNAGDINGDGYDDLIVGASGASSARGAALVVLGKASGFIASLNVSALVGTNGFTLQGEATGDEAGLSVSRAGDVNGDGLGDLLVGAPQADLSAANAGATYVVYGSASALPATMALSALNASTGFRIAGASAGERSGSAVSDAGDVNGDGYDDLIIGAYLADINGTNSGAAYVVFGASSPALSSFSVSALNGTNGFRLAGVLGGDYAGFAVTGAGDINGDGYDDLLVGARGADPAGVDSGTAYLVFGRASGFASSLQLSAIDGINGFRLAGAAGGDLAGTSVSEAGDVNGDGYDDLLIGSTSTSGASHVFFGGNFTGAVTRPGTSGADPLNGTAFDDVFAAGSGDDNVLALAGNDRARLGAGNDSAEGDLGNDSIDGDAGNDNLGGGDGFDALDGGQGNDVLRGGINADTLRGGTGDDLLNGGKGTDFLYGGAGNDTLIGALGNDLLDGGSGLDTADYSASPDGVTVNLLLTGAQLVSVATGLDTLLQIENLIGSALNDNLTGTSGNNTLAGGNGNDTLSGDNGFDSLDGGEGNDSLAGGLNADTLVGGLGNDFVGGGQGTDSLLGGDGDDTLVGGLGTDRLTGGAGADRYVFRHALDGVVNIDTFADLETGVDVVELSVSIFTALQGSLGNTIGTNANLLYNNTTGVLAYDADGAGAIPPLTFAIVGVGSHPNALGNDFLIVA